MRDGRPIAAVVCIDGLRALRHVAEEFVEPLGEERLTVQLGEDESLSYAGIPWHLTSFARRHLLIMDPTQHGRYRQQLISKRFTVSAELPIKGYAEGHRGAASSSLA